MDVFCCGGVSVFVVGVGEEGKEGRKRGKKVEKKRRKKDTPTDQRTEKRTWTKFILKVFFLPRPKTLTHKVSLSSSPLSLSLSHSLLL
jgi:hypothetical protein